VTHTTPAEVPPVCDAGDDVWVQRVFPMVLGRKPHGAHEVQIWSKLAAEQGRPAVIRALAKSPEYDGWWKTQLSDMVFASRVGFVDDSGCFENAELPKHDGDLSRFIRESPPDGDYGPVFNMADVIVDSLVADDISTVYQANLFAKYDFTDAVGCVVSLADVESVVRKYQGDQLLTVYLDRNVSCMSCHNSEFSVTDDPDPALDRAWGRGALFEKALFGDSSGPVVPDEFYAINKDYGFADSTGYFAYYDKADSYTHHVWGMNQKCGSFTRDDPKYDYLDVETSYFGHDFGPGGSTFDLDRLFRQGVDDMTDAGITIGDDASVDPGQAFAYLTAQNFVDQTWKLAFGNRLLLGYGMSRNQAQQQRLQALTDHFVSDGWSLSELLVDITSDPYFNAGTPETCDSQDYGMAPVVDPYSVMNEGDLANNGSGELVHRQTARTLLRSLYSALDWGQPTEFFSAGASYNGDTELALQEALGVFHSDTSPGFNGVDFQGSLTWESNFFVCTNPNGTPGYLRDLFAYGRTKDATVEEEVLALKDRLTSHGEFDDDTERQLVEDLLQVPLDSKVAEVDEDTFARNFSLLCGVMTQSPEFLMTVEPEAPGPVPRLLPELAYDCQDFEAWTAAARIDATCE